MNPAKRLIACFLALNAIALFALTFNFFQIRNNSDLMRNVQLIEEKAFATPSKETKAKTNPAKYKFYDEKIAYQLLKALDVFENGEPDAPSGKSYSEPYFGTTINNRYCDERRLHFASHPESIFSEKKNFMTELWKTHSFRKTTIPKLGKDLHPNIGLSMSKKQEKSFSEKLSPKIDIFFTKSWMLQSRLVGKQFSCLTQISNHCPGNQNLSTKDKVAQSLVEYAKSYKSRPQCFNTDKFFPETYNMLKPDQCKKFFEFFNSKAYFKLKAERNIVYIRKIGSGVHQGKGVFPVHDDEEQYIRKLYKNGTKCESVTENNIIQSFVHNPLLLMKRKFHFRVYMYVASTNPFIVYYHDGYLRISFQEYDTTSKELGAFITNLGMTEILFQDQHGVGNRTVDEIKGDSYFFYPQFHKYLTENGYINDKNWLDTHLRTDMRTAMAHLIRMTQSRFWKKSSVTELYGVDFMMDEDLNLWFIEANSGPLIAGWDDFTNKFFDKLLRDALEISIGLLHSRTKRIINYVNKLIKDKDAWTMTNKGVFTVKDLKERQEEFRLISMNKFEPEFEPRAKNGFIQIMDENREGVERYNGLISEECLKR